MNDLYEMPPKCQNCPYWEWAVSPYLCDCDKRYENNEIPDRMHNSGINKDIRYFVLIYHNGEIIEEHTIIGQDNAYNYGENRIKELGYGDYKVKVD